MVNIVDLRREIVSEIFDYQILMDKLKYLKAPHQKINQMLKKGEIIRIKKGLYIWGEKYQIHPYKKEILANLIYGPSYVSLHWALSYYQLIPERVETVTSITSKKNKDFNTPVGVFKYHSIARTKYSVGIVLNQKENNSFFMASPEKALVDYLYIFYRRKRLNLVDMGHLLLDDLRIDIKQLKNILVLKNLKQIVLSYNENCIHLMYEFLGKKIKL